MRYLVDTHLLIWAKTDPARLPSAARTIIEDDRNTLSFSVVTPWEIVIKRALGRADFNVDPRVLRRTLLDDGYPELEITATHALAVADLPRLHGDPFDRMLIAQARTEQSVLLTKDKFLVRYGDGIQLV